ncbi:MAG: ABC transporter permease [Lachnospiraceae bacterium]|nr:ABC transporter permease [Lachnospiraceae bacterium]
MKSPLRKRLPRELKSEFAKYAVIFILMVSTIGLVSGFLVADNSMIIAYNEGFTKYNVEDGNFRIDGKMNRAQKKAIESFGVTIYDDLYIEEPIQKGSTMRVYQNRTQVNLACVMEGALPAKPGEIAIDRMYADNNDLHVGDMLVGVNRSWLVTGLIALPDYSCLFQDNNDSMFDAVKFGVAVVCEEEFASYPAEELFYEYCWRYDVPPVNDVEERDLADDFMELVNGEVHLKAFVPRYQNQAIMFTGDDMGGDKAMMVVLLYIIIVIMAFVFSITISNTIQQEATVIGTLMASGYTRGELIRHYMAAPLAVTLIGALFGNILGYTWLKDFCADMYYGSYSLPTYVTVWNAEAFLETTVVPVVMMAFITFFVLWKKLHLSPLQFLRRNLSSKRQRYAAFLPKWMPFFTRFRMRVILQNRHNYLVLFLGIILANLLLMFGMVLPVVLNHFQETMEQNMLCNYQYILQIPYDVMDEKHKLKSMIALINFQSEIETENETAEKFSAYSLKTLDGQYKSEAVLCYGVQEDSRYVPIGKTGQQVYISSAYAEKYEVGVGDRIYLKETYEDKYYVFEVGGVYDYMGAIAVFMEQGYLNQVFDLGEDFFCGYLAETPITDIDEEYIGTVIDLDALTKISRQLDVSMGSMMYLVDVFAVLIFVVIIFILSKIIIEKNGQSISMTKILGYTNLEISGLYIISTTIVVVVCMLISLPIEKRFMVLLFKYVMMGKMTGWIPFYAPPDLYVKMFVIGMVTYAVVAVFEYGKVKKVPMDEALKNVE